MEERFAVGVVIVVATDDWNYWGKKVDYFVAGCDCLVWFLK